MNFEELNIVPQLKEAAKKMNYITATDVQVKSIQLMLAGHNVVVQSHTGSGKTAAFGIPISEKIFTGKSRGALILCPTRELALQVKNEIAKLNFRTRLNVSAFYGGHGMSIEIRAARQGVDILCATPGRLLDHFRSGTVNPKQFDTVVLDEADRLLDMGFIHDLRDILEAVKPTKTHLFSATLAGKVAGLIDEYIPSYEEIIIPQEIIGINIIERHIKVDRGQKLDALLEIIGEAKDGRVLVFVSTKRGADFVARKLYKSGLKAETIHGDKSQRAREFALENFKSGKVKILVATDVAARGLQIDNVEYVVNYDLANDADMHKHRIGRTGRMGGKGEAISFVSQEGVVIEPKRFQRGGGGNNYRGGQRHGGNQYHGGGDQQDNSGFNKGSRYNMVGFDEADAYGTKGPRTETYSPRGNRNQSGERPQGHGGFGHGRGGGNRGQGGRDRNRQRGNRRGSNW